MKPIGYSISFQSKLFESTNRPKANISGRLFKGVKRAFATYLSRLSHTCTCLFRLQIITEKICVRNFLCFIFLKKKKKKKKIVFYRSIYKIEPESLENAEIRFLSSWSFIFLPVQEPGWYIYTYDLCRFDCYFGTWLILIYMWCSFHGCIHL